jgi:hypothetical protein
MCRGILEAADLFCGAGGTTAEADLAAWAAQHDAKKVED